MATPAARRACSALCVKLGMFPAEKPKKTVYNPKPYEQMTYPGQRVQVDVKVVPTSAVSLTRSCAYSSTPPSTNSPVCAFLAAYPEQSTYSSADFLQKTVQPGMHAGASEWSASRRTTALSSPIDFSNSKRDLPTLFEATAAELDIRHKLIRPYTPRHNGKVERSHREDQKRFYSCHSFYSFDDFAQAACCPQPPLQQLPYETPSLAFSLQSSLSNMFDKPTGGRYGVRLKASAPSIHMMRADITTEVSPIVGSEKQSEELVMSLLEEFEGAPQKIWESNIFGKSLHELVNEGLHNKLYRLPADARIRMQETIERMINEGCSGLICIIL